MYYALHVTKRPRPRVSYRRSTRLIVLFGLFLAVALAGCGGNTHGSASSPTDQRRSFATADQFAGVLSACEQNGASSLLPGSNGQDTSSVPDNTSEVCGCWTQWMQQSLDSSDQQLVITNVEQSGSIPIIPNLTFLSDLTTSLQSCDAGQTPTTGASGAPEPSSSGSVQPTAPLETSPNPHTPHKTTTPGTSCPGGYNQGTGTYAATGGWYQGVTASGVGCSIAMEVVKAYGTGTDWSVRPMSYTANGFRCVTKVGPVPNDPDNDLEGNTTCTGGASTVRFIEPPGD